VVGFVPGHNPTRVALNGAHFDTCDDRLIKPDRLTKFHNALTD
jgi:hypothetical protein